MTQKAAVLHEMVILDHSGDTKLIWDEEKPDEVTAAKEMFDSLKKKGYLAYTVEKGGKQGEEVKKFDPTLEGLILAPQLKGG